MQISHLIDEKNRRPSSIFGFFNEKLIVTLKLQKSSHSALKTVKVHLKHMIDWIMALNV